MIHLALLALSAATLTATAAPAQITGRVCADLALTLETNHGGGMRVVSAVVRNLSATAFAAPVPGSIRVVWHGENGSTQDFPLAASIAAGGQVSMVVGMWPDAMHGTLHATLQLPQGATRDCSTANNGMRLAL